jgi:maltose/moltooligosaccharide transporter
VPLTRRWGARRLHGICLLAAGLGMMALPAITSRVWLFLPMLGIGLGWASIMGNPYVMLANATPPERTGVYMGIFNMFIVIPMLLEGVTLPFFYGSWLGGDPRAAVMLAAALLIAAAIASQRVSLSTEQAAVPQQSVVSH